MGSVPEFEPIRPVLDVPVDMQASLLRDRTARDAKVPGLQLNTVRHRRRISTNEQIDYRVKLLRSLRSGWKNEDTEAKFFEALHRIKTDGAALFGGLIDPAIFARLVEEYSKVQAKSGNNAFMHSYVNLALEHEFILGGSYVQAFSHPLLVALISYLLGGSIRIVDFRGKNSDPISVNAQDNMLHVDNTPFKEEYKVLLTWRRGEVKGPSGQNFTFLPWTHRGNREIILSDEGLPWSTEADSLFVTDDAINGLFDFQRRINGTTRVVEARHPEQPLAIVFPAGALVHHRYRTEEGDPRSCIITAYHLSSRHRGRISELPPVSGRRKTLIEFLVGYQDENSNGELLDILAGESSRIEEKLDEIFQPSHPSKLLDLDSLALKGDKLTQWRQAVMGAPSPIAHRYMNNLGLAGVKFKNLQDFTERLAAVMDYDKHCNLQMILYEDGREEIRKPGRKIIGEMKKDNLQTRLQRWTPGLCADPFSANDLIEPRTLRAMCDAVAAMAKNLADDSDTGTGRDGKESDCAVGQRKILLSMSRLMMDLGEAMMRCDGEEAFVVTSLFLFLTSEDIYSQMQESDQLAVRFMVVKFLRNYVAAVMLVEEASSQVAQ